jgi:thiamine biosynthesis lipoprotein
MRRNRAIQAHRFEALGTACSVFGVGLWCGRLVDGELWVRHMGARLTRFSRESELARLNAAAGRWVEVSPELEALLHDSIRAYETSMGLVNVAVLPSMVAIGYVSPLPAGERGRESGMGWQSTGILGAVQPLPPLSDVLTVRGGRARLEPGCGIDLGGVAKGWMADRLCEQLGPNCLANLGGDLMARGGGPNGDGWPVGIGGVTVILRDQAAATSSTRRRRWGEVHHLIDPRTGLPAHTGLDEVSVVGPTAFDAEVIAKTALLLGPDAAPGYCAANALAWWLSP